MFRKHNTDYKILAKSKFFNKKWYLKTYPDVAASKMNPIDHYLTYGWKEGRNPSAFFDGNAYLRDNADVKLAGRNPLLHYEKYGHKEGREICVSDCIEYNKRFNRAGRWVARLFCYKNKDVKILVVLHLYYMNSWKSIKQYLDNLKGYNYDLVVTYTDEYYKQSVLEKILKYKQNTKLFKYKNKGFDVGPFIDVISRVNISDYDIVFKLHSKGVRRKRIFIYNQIFKYKDWFYNLYDGILGAFAVHKVIDVFATDKKVGLVASKNLIVHDPKHKQFFTKQVADKYKLKIKDNYQYVAGSCFVIRTQCLEKIKKLNLTIDSFADTKRGEFSLAHAMERLMCAAVETMGLNFYGIPVAHNLYEKELEDAQKTSAIRLLDDDRINLDYEFFYKALEGRKIKNYFIKEIALKNINRFWKGQIIKLYDCAPYSYLNGDMEIYKTYCTENKQIYGWEMSVDRFDALLNNMEQNGYNPKSMPVLDAKDNIIIDGQHRSCYLLKKFGPEHKIQALFLEFD